MFPHSPHRRSRHRDPNLPRKPRKCVFCGLSYHHATESKAAYCEGDPLCPRTLYPKRRKEEGRALLLFRIHFALIVTVYALLKKQGFPVDDWDYQEGKGMAETECHDVTLGDWIVVAPGTAEIDQGDWVILAPDSRAERNQGLRSGPW